MVNYDIAHSETTHKYLLKTFQNKSNKKEYNLQIQQHNICHTNIIAIKDVIVIAEKGRENKELLAIENIDKIAIAEVAKVSNAIDLTSKHNQAISNANIDVAKDLKLISIKQYQRYIDQIQDKVDWLYKNKISTLRVFVKYS